ncbi:hypothetical protein [Albibacterium profundi]|uniref:Uncharacterized protein n=1 Tax=Albibacterium profundi TaxID=3134906 RepID=A0ABV5CCN3_9SPHI
MKKIFKILAIVMVLAVQSSCEKHVVELDAEPISDETTQIQLFYMVPLASGTANSINKVELNGKLLTNETTPLNTFNFLPSGAVNKFFATETGSVNLKLYRGAVTDMTLAYDKDVNLLPGKQALFIHDFDEPPVILPHPMPMPSVTTENTATTAWVRFINLMYESAGVPTDLTIQYQWQYTTDNETGAKSEWFDLGEPVAFGEATGWEPVTVNKTVEQSSGSARIDYRIRLIGADGSDQGSLQIRNSAGNMVDYSDWWNAFIGRAYNHVFAGYRDAASLGVGIRQSTAL